MSSACPALAAPKSAVLPVWESLDGWQRCLQSEPLGCRDFPEPTLATAIAPDDATATVVELIAETLCGLTYNWMIAGVVVTGTTGSVALLAFTQLATVPPAPDCTQLARAAALRDELTCWQTAIAAGDLQARQQGLDAIGNWPSTEPLFAEGQDLLDQWSWSVLQDARHAQAGDDWVTAVNFAAQVPPSSPRFEEAQTLLARLQEQQQVLAEALNQTAQAALETADWATASQSLQALQALDHPAAPLALPHHLARQITAERRATQLWNQAQRTWNLGTPSDQASAIAIASRISSSTYRWSLVQPQITLWREELLILAQARLAQGDWPGAIALAESITHEPHRTDQPQPWLTLAQAQRLATISTRPTSPVLARTVGLPAAILAIHSIPAEHDWHDPEIALSHQWQSHLKAERSSSKGATPAAHPLCSDAVTAAHPPDPADQLLTLQPLFPEQRCRPQFSPLTESPKSD